MAPKTTVDTDKYIPLSQVPRLSFLPPRRRGRKLHKSTPYRWSTDGLNGVRLRYVKCGGVRCTTVNWLNAFFSELAEKEATVVPDEDTQGATTSRRQEEVEKELDRMGLKGNHSDVPENGGAA